MLNDLIEQYIKMFGYEPDVNGFFRLEEDECIEKEEELYENDYFNDNYMEEVI